MTDTSGSGERTWISLVAIGLVLVLVVAAAVVLLRTTAGRTVTAYFTQAPGLYVDDEVRVLGVRVGTVDEITPLPGQVRVELTIDTDQPIPADARAAITAPSLVSGRFVQLAPVYRGGPQLADGATIPIERTAVPVEWDQFKRQVTTLAQDLGPNASGDLRGALNRVLDVGAANLQGQGKTINSTIRQLSDAATTVSDGRDDLFGTVRNLQLVVTALRDSDDQVGEFQRRLADVSGVLDENKDELATALKTFDRVVPRVQDFVAENRRPLSDAVKDLTRVSDNLRDNRQELANLLQKAPTAFVNLDNIYDQLSGTLTGALALTQFSDPASFICSIIYGAAATQTGAQTGPASPAFTLCRTALGPFGDILAMQNIPLSLPTIFGPQPMTAATAGVAAPAVRGGGR